jgi:hypothetical protein
MALLVLPLIVLSPIVLLLVVFASVYPLSPTFVGSGIVGGCS